MLHTRRRARTSQAFTLLELIVVIVVLGVLAALALPTYAAVVTRARASTTEASAAAIADASKLLSSFDSGRAATDADYATHSAEAGLTWDADANTVSATAGSEACVVTVRNLATGDLGPARCAQPALSPTGRYTSEVFASVTARPVETFMTVPANPAIDPAAPYDFDLEFQRFSPASDPAPTGRKAVVFVNGGGWIVGDDDGRAQQQPAAEAWARAGWVSFTMEYPTYPGVFWPPGDPALVAKYELATRDSARTTLAFVEHLYDNAAAYGIDPDQLVLAGWSAGGVIALETLNDDYRSVEGFTHFPKVRVSMSGDWAFAGTSPLNTTNDPVVAQVYFTTDSGYVNSTYTPEYRDNCASLSSRGVPCSQFRFDTTGHNLWLSAPDGSPGPWGGTITDCFDGSPIEDCSPLSQIQPFAADAASG